MNDTMLTVSKESSDFEIELLLLLSSLPKINDRTVPEPCLWDEGREWYDDRPMKDDCNSSREKLQLAYFFLQEKFTNLKQIRASIQKTCFL